MTGLYYILRHHRQPGFFHYFLIGLSALLSACANIVAPTGGPRDTSPPVVIASEPEQGSTKYHGNTIRLQFDEYIQIKDESKHLLISPPPGEPPELRVRGKSLYITLPGEITDSTTYWLQFGNAIQDFTEGNPLSGYSFVFTSGNTLDSMGLKGKVLQADNLVPAAQMLVMLYKNTADSVIFTEKPRYIARTDDQGAFTFRYLAPGAYKIIALKDVNNNYLYDFPVEPLAFLDSLVRPVFVPTDTGSADSINIKEATPELTLFLFKDQDTLLRLLKSYLDKPGLLVLPFSTPVSHYSLTPFGSSTGIPAQWYKEEWGKEKDTIFCWFSPELTEDTLHLILKVENMLTDTLEIDVKRIGKTGRFKKGDPAQAKMGFTAQPAGTMRPDEKARITFSYPLKQWDFRDILLTEGSDTLTVTPSFADSLNRILVLDHPWKENTSYRWLIPSGAFTDLAGNTNDTIVSSFQTKSREDYGTLRVRFSGTLPGQYILYLVNEKDKVFYEQTIKQQGVWQLPLLLPGMYTLKVVYDQNNSSHWDSGNYRKKLQAEKVAYYPKTLDIRANWEVEETWEW